MSEYNCWNNRCTDTIGHLVNSKCLLFPNPFHVDNCSGYMSQDDGANMVREEISKIKSRYDLSWRIAFLSNFGGSSPCPDLEIKLCKEERDRRFSFTKGLDVE